MADEDIPDFSPDHFNEEVEIGQGITMLFYGVDKSLPANWGMRHTCIRTEGRGTIICAPRLCDVGHFILSEDPLTVQPSLLCTDCGLHGFVRDGAWHPA